MVPMLLAWISFWTNNQEASEMRYSNTHVMSYSVTKPPWVDPLGLRHIPLSNCLGQVKLPIRQVDFSKVIGVRSQRCGCLVTWFCYQLIAKPGNKTATPLWPDPSIFCRLRSRLRKCKTLEVMQVKFFWYIEPFLLKVIIAYIIKTFNHIFIGQYLRHTTPAYTLVL